MLIEQYLPTFDVRDYHEVQVVAPADTAYAVPPTRSRRLGMGGVALGLLLVAEWTLVLWLRGLSIGEYVAAETQWREQSTS